MSRTPPRPYARPSALAPMLLGVVALTTATSCHRKPKQYESVVQLVRYDVAERDENGKPTLVDVELEWDPCPGDQIEIVRGGPAFAECMGKHKVGEMLPAFVVTNWDERGYYQWDITKVAECDRPPMPDDVSSFEKIQECSDVKSHGVAVGFECNRQPYSELIKVCPWMKRDLRDRPKRATSTLPSSQTALSIWAMTTLASLGWRTL